jgi:cytochrome bd-type quinol oxidase subunit 1
MIEQEWAILLARIQFAFTVSFHFLFPAFSIGLASFLAVLEGLWLKTGNGVYARRSLTTLMRRHTAGIFRLAHAEPK